MQPFLNSNRVAVIVERQWLWAFPQIEGVPPSPRGGHSATLTGASLVIFGVSKIDSTHIYRATFTRDKNRVSNI